MQLPFTSEEFLGLFARYNQAIWPAQIITYLLSLVVVGLALWKIQHHDCMISAILGVFWLWIGIVFLALYYRQINGTVAVVFGILLAVQGLLFLYSGLIQQRLAFAIDMSPSKIVGALFMLYALVIYPLLGMAGGHGYPYAPLFGVAPCPTTIFTFGVLLWTDSKFPLYLVVIPLIWSIFGVGAALALGIYEDFGLPVSGILGTALLLMRGQGFTPGQRPSHPVMQ